MNRLKVFFYNKNDILLVLLILAVAAFIIYTRIGVIMDFPEKAAKEAAATESVADRQASSTTETESSTRDDSQTKEETSEKTSMQARKKIRITISDKDSSFSVAEKLQKSGLVGSASKFNKYIIKKGKEGSIISGRFKIPENASYKKILSIITN